VRVGPLAQLLLRTMPVFFRRSVGLATLFPQLMGSLGDLLMAGARMLCRALAKLVWFGCLHSLTSSMG
jgi:hypothetical protein